MKINVMFLPHGNFALLFGEISNDISQMDAEHRRRMLANLGEASGAKFVLASPEPLEPEGFAYTGDESHQGTPPNVRVVGWEPAFDVDMGKVAS